jgi:hypothetical protein
MPRIITDIKLKIDLEGKTHLEVKSVELRTFGSQIFDNPITGEETDWEQVQEEIEIAPVDPPVEEPIDPEADSNG